MKHIVLIFFLIEFHMQTVFSIRTKDKIYIPINGFHCFRRLNGTHTTGCTSSLSGATGVVHFVTTEDDIDFILNNPPAPPYSPVIPSNLFTRKNIMRLKNDKQGYVSSIVLIDGNQTESFSTELKCPNQYSNFNPEACSAESGSRAWNPFGSELLHEDFSFPILYLEDTSEVDKMRYCFEKFNTMKNQKDRNSLCSIQISSFMSAAVDSEVCMRRTNYLNNLSPRRYCDPLQGKNVFASVFPREENEKIKYIIISSRMDTTSMFSDIGLGAMDSLISFATLINVAHVLSTWLQHVVETKFNVIFTIFNGEAYDYIGSQRFVYDLKTGSKSKGLSGITLENIELLIDIGWLDDLSQMTLYAKENFSYGENVYNYLKDYSDQNNFGIKVSKAPIDSTPPTSAQSFLRENKQFPVIVLSSKLKNKFYHSIYDNQENINYKYRNTTRDFTELANSTDTDFDKDSVQLRIRNISTALASTIYRIVTNSDYVGTSIANPVLSDEFLFCFLNASDCPLFKAVSYHNSFIGTKHPPLRYISVPGSPTQEATSWAYLILGFLTGRILEDTHKENCTRLPLYWFSGYNGKGECRLTTNNFSEALSPAFIEKNYDWKSGKYSTWTESTWQELSARIYLQPSHNQDFISLVVGSAVTIFSIVIVICSNSRSNMLFNNIINIL